MDTAVVVGFLIRVLIWGIGPILTGWGVWAAVRWSKRIEERTDRILDEVDALRTENRILRDRVERLGSGDEAGTGSVSLPAETE